MGNVEPADTEPADTGFRFLDATLVETFDIEPYSDVSSKKSNFIRLVLGSIDAKFCKKYSLESS